MIELKEHMDMFKLVGERLKKPVECMAIGGSAMLFYGLKSATKDVDIVFFSESDRALFAEVLEESGFSRKIIGDGKSRKGIPIVMEGRDTRFDLFLGEVFQFTISQDMRERVEQKHEFGKLILEIVSHEDIIILKSVTDREGDRTDAKNIIGKVSVNWDAIIKEAQWQTENGNKAFTVYLFDFLEEIYDGGTAIPKQVMRKVRKISEEEMLKALKANSEGKALRDAFRH
jgi:hypothetical protein